MATVTVTLTGICAGGEHLTFDVTGARTLRRTLLRAEIEQPITDDELDAAIKVVAKLVRSGRTLAQARTVLQGGSDVGE